MNDNEFKKGELKVTFDPRKCKHSGECSKHLSEVFRESVIPWIDLEGAPSKEIVNQIKKCPSAALSYEWDYELVEVK